jgi:FkbM family methyltransferase
MIRISNVNRSLRGRLHFAAARAADNLTRSLGIRALLHPALAALGACFGNSAKVRLSVEGQLALEIPLSDAYWASVGMDGSYEPEVFDFLDRLPARPTLFVDCGANIGWWSLLGEKRWGWTCVAIEASSALVRRIEAIRTANDARFAVLANAVWNTDGETLTFRTGTEAHAGGHVAGVAGFVAGWRVNALEKVATVTVDAVVSKYRSTGQFDRTVIKIDVEGAECEAILGAKKSIESGALLIYEDHGQDRSCRPTATLLDLGLEVYALDAAVVTRVSTVGEAMALKRNSRKGYNFLAVKPGALAPNSAKIYEPSSATCSFPERA